MAMAQCSVLDATDSVRSAFRLFMVIHNNDHMLLGQMGELARNSSSKGEQGHSQQKRLL